MGTQFLAGLMGGLSSGIAQNRQRQVEQDYRKALIEQSKLQTKMLENKLNLAQYEQQAMGALAAYGGLPVPPPPQMQPVQPVVQEQPKQSLLGRIFNPQPPAPTPSPTPAATTSQTPTPIPQMIAQGQMAGGLQGTGQLSQDQAKALARDIYLKKMFDLSPWQARFQAEEEAKKGKVNKYLDMGVGYVPMSAENQVLGPMIPKAPSYQSYETESPTGAKGRTFYDPYYPLGRGGPGTVQTQPEGLKSADIGRFNMIMQAQSKLGDVNNMVFPNGQLDRSIIAKATVPGGGIGKGSQLYSKMYQMVDSALRLETGAQANASEIETKMREYWPRAIDTEETIKQKMKDLNEYVNGAVQVGDPTGQIRAMRQGGLGQRPQLPNQQITPAQAEQMLIKKGYRRDAQGNWVR